MPHLRKNSDGFSAFEAILVIIIIGLIVVVGYYVWHNNTKGTNDNTVSVATTSTTQPKNQTSEQAKPNPYAGWKTYTLPVEKLSFKYPPTWAVDTADSGAPTPTQDQVTIDASDGFTFNVIDGVSDGGDLIPLVPGAAVPVKYLDQNDYLAFSYARDPNGPGFSKSLVSGVGLQTDPNNLYSSPSDQTAVGPNGTSGAVNAKNIAISCFFKSGISLAQAQSSPDIKDCKLVIESMHY